MASKPRKKKAVVAVATLTADTGWPLDRQERRDFYHRPRVFPQAVGSWRKATIKLILESPKVFASASAQANEAGVRGLLDHGISYLREVARIASLVVEPTGRKQAVGSLSNINWHASALRVLTRLGPYRELGFQPEQLSPARRKALLPELTPPPLRRSLARDLEVLAGSTCTSRKPRCEGCELRNLCRTYRKSCVEASAKSDAPTFVDLFSGAGGLTEGFKRAGFRPLLALDKDASALRTYWLNHPEVPDEHIVCSDIRELTQGRLKKLVGRVDVLLGAPPCQGFSSAGFRSKRTATGYRAIHDDRNFLFEDMMRIAGELKPRLVLLENVPGMKSAKRDDVSFLDGAARMLEEKWNYRTAVWKLNASAFGVPQDRTRIFLVACRKGPVPSRPEQEYQDTLSRAFDIDALPPVTLDEAIFDLPTRVPEQGQGVERLIAERDIGDRRYRRFLKKFKMTSDSELVYNHSVRFHNERDLELYNLLDPGDDSIHFLEKHDRPDLMRYRRDVFDDKYARLRPDRPCKTIVAHLAKDGNGFVHPTQVRSISFREAARVQTFHDRFAFTGSPSDQWVQLGNAVPPLLGEAIGKSFMERLPKGK